MNISLTVDSLL